MPNQRPTPSPSRQLSGLALLWMVAAAAHAAESPAAVQSLAAAQLSDVPGKEVIMITVDYPPGGASPPHRHDADVFVYVLEGSVVMQVDGQAPVTVPAGGTFSERPDDVHRQSRNASATEPARLLVFMVKNTGAPPTMPVTDAPAPH